MTGPVSLERKSAVRKLDEPMSRAEFEAAIRAVGAERYHDKHPFHHMPVSYTHLTLPTNREV